MASNKISNGLVALSSAAILAVYAVGYDRTSTAAGRFAAQDERKPSIPVRSQFVAPAEALPPLTSGETVSGAPVADLPSRADEQKPPETHATNSNSESGATAISVPANTDLEVPAPEEPVAATAAVTPVVPVPVAAPAAADPNPPAQHGLYKDGTYTGWGSCRHGDIQAAVVIEGGRIASVAIAQCYTRYPCSWISNAPGQVVSRQSIDVDYVSGATQSINAFRDAVFEALSNAR